MRCSQVTTSDKEVKYCEIKILVFFLTGSHPNKFGFRLLCNNKATFHIQISFKKSWQWVPVECILYTVCKWGGGGTENVEINCLQNQKD